MELSHLPVLLALRAVQVRVEHDDGEGQEEHRVDVVGHPRAQLVD